MQDSRGTPLPDAWVIAWPKDRRGNAVVQARSDPEGRFLLARLQPGTWTLLAEAAGFGTLEIDRTVPDPGRLVLALEGEGHNLGGMVLGAQNRGQPEARVVLGGPGLRWPRETVADARGVFSFAGLGLGRFSVRATHGKSVSAAVNQTIEEGKAPLLPLRLPLGPGAFVEGRVRDDQDRDLPGTTIDLLTMPSDDLPATCKADEQGQFVVGPVRPGRYQLFAKLEGHMQMDAPEPLLGAGSRVQVALRMARQARVSGRLLDEDNAPIAGAPVSVVGLVAGHDEVIVLPGALPTAAEAALLPPGSVARQGSIRTAFSDGQGRFAIVGLAPGRSRLDVAAPDKLPLRREPLLLAPADNRDLGDLVVATGVTLSGRVLGQDSQALEDVQLEARYLGKPPRPPIRANADPQGQFALRVPVGEYALTARAKSHAPQTISFVRASGQPDPSEFRLAASVDGGVPSPTREAPTRRR
ncbi:MAG TPA: carboxypeptidase-like regulatory domain-containing protein [Polyangia bacterium]